MAVRMLLTVKWSLIVPTEATRSSGQNRDRGYVIEYYSAAESLPSAMSFQSSARQYTTTTALQVANESVAKAAAETAYLSPDVNNSLQPTTVNTFCSGSEIQDGNTRANRAAQPTQVGTYPASNIIHNANTRDKTPRFRLRKRASRRSF